jgi:cysteine synthase
MADDAKQNWKAHTRWTGPQILRQLPEIKIICAGMGTSGVSYATSGHQCPGSKADLQSIGTMTGLGTYFKAIKPNVLRLGYAFPNQEQLSCQVLIVLQRVYCGGGSCPWTAIACPSCPSTISLEVSC